MTERSTVNFPGAGESRNANDVIDEKQIPRNENGLERTRRFRRRVITVGAAAVATLVAAGAFAFTLKADNHEAPRSQPTAGAGLLPGEGESAATAAPSASEAGEPSQEAAPTDMNEWTVDNFKYNIDGETLTGVTELEAKYGITVADNPTGEDAANALIKNVNTWINSLDTEEDKTTYAAYSPNTNGTDQLARAGGVAYDLAAPAWKQVLTTTERAAGSANAPGPDKWIDTMRDLHVQNIQDAAKKRNEDKAKGLSTDGDKHYAGYEVKNVNVLTTYQGETAFIINMTFTGPDRSVDIILNATMRQVEGANSEPMWKLIGLTDEAKK